MVAEPGSELMKRAITGQLTVEEQRQCADAILADYAQPNPTEMPDLNAVWLARSWLRANRRDDAEPVTAAWVRAVLPATRTSQQATDVTGHSAAEYAGAFGRVEWAWWNCRTMFGVWVNGRLVTDAGGFRGMTRGEFRALCRGLRIELTEPAEVPPPGLPTPTDGAGQGGSVTGSHPLAWEIG